MLAVQLVVTVLQSHLVLNAPVVARWAIELVGLTLACAKSLNLTEWELVLASSMMVSRSMAGGMVGHELVWMLPSSMLALLMLPASTLLVLILVRD